MPITPTHLCVCLVFCLFGNPDIPGDISCIFISVGDNVALHSNCVRQTVPVTVSGEVLILLSTGHGHALIFLIRTWCSSNHPFNPPPLSYMHRPSFFCMVHSFIFFSTRPSPAVGNTPPAHPLAEDSAGVTILYDPATTCEHWTKIVDHLSVCYNAPPRKTHPT